MAFAPPMNNIPTVSLREEHNTLSSLIFSSDFAQALKENRLPIWTPLFDWHGSSEDLTSTLVQRAVLGVESYVSMAVWIELTRKGRMTHLLNQQVRNPFSIKGDRGTAAAYYHKLPSLIDPDLSIATLDPELFEELSDFYRCVRNPLFHGSQFASTDVRNVTNSFAVIDKVYAWADLWHQPVKSIWADIKIAIKADA